MAMRAQLLLFFFYPPRVCTQENRLMSAATRSLRLAMMMERKPIRAITPLTSRLDAAVREEGTNLIALAHSRGRK